jgi:hypothetical protein
MADESAEVVVVIQAVRDEAKRWADLKPVLEQLHAAVDALDLAPSAFWIGPSGLLDERTYAQMYAVFRLYLLEILKGGAVEFGQLSQALNKIAEEYDRTDQIGKLNLNKIFDAGQTASPAVSSPPRSADSLSAAAPAPRPATAPPVHATPTPPPVQSAPTPLPPPVPATSPPPAPSMPAAPPPSAPSMPAAPPPPAPPELPTVSSVQPLPTFTGMPVVSELPKLSELDSPPPPPPPPPPSTVAAPGATIPTVLDAGLFGWEEPADGEEA